MGWKSFTVLYENEESLIRLQGVLKLRGPNDPPITIRQLDPDDDHRTLLKDVQMSGENHIILHCDPRRVMTVLRQAKEVKMMEDYQNYVITDLVRRKKSIFFVIPSFVNLSPIITDHKLYNPFFPFPPRQVSVTLLRLPIKILFFPL